MNSSAKRVLHLVYEDAGAPTGGMGVHVRELVNRQRQAHDVVVVQLDMHQQRGSFRRDWKECRRSEWEYEPGTHRSLSCFPVFNFDSHMYEPVQRHITIITFMRNILRYLSDFRADIIHVHDAHLWRVAECLQDLWGSKTVVTVHLSGLLSNPWLAKHVGCRFALQTELSAYTGADVCICVSKYYADLVRHRCHRDAEVVLNGINVAEFDEITRHEIAAIRRRYPADKRVIGFVGRLTPQKGIEHIIHAARMRPDLHFVVVSHYHPMQGCQTQVDLDQAIEELPNLQWEQTLTQREKRAFMRACSVGVVPSNYEPFGIVALEWMAAKTLLVVSHIDGLKEFCTSENAILIKPDGEELAKAVSSEADPAKLKRAYITAQGMTWDKTHEAVEDIYRRL